MNIYSLSLICSFVISMFFVFEAYAYFVRIIPILIDRSFGDITEFNSKLNRRKAVLRSWFFVLFSVACGYALYMIKQNENKYLILFFFATGIVLMFLFCFFPRKIEKNTYYQSLENSVPIDKTPDELKSSTITRGEKINEVDHSKNSFNDRHQIKELISIRKRSILPLSISDDEIKQKYKELKTIYNLFCDQKDFSRMLKRENVHKKILFLDSNNIEPKLTINQYLAVLNFIVDGNLEDFRRNQEVIKWVGDNFDYRSIESKDISHFKACVKTQKKR
jgi:hypothetical protein